MPRMWEKGVLTSYVDVTWRYLRLCEEEIEIVPHCVKQLKLVSNGQTTIIKAKKATTYGWQEISVVEEVTKDNSFLIGLIKMI